MTNRWETMETLADFIFLGSKITADGEIKRSLLLERKVMLKLDSVLKSRLITFLTKIHLAKAMVFPVVMYGLGFLSSHDVDLWVPIVLPQGSQVSFRIVRAPRVIV